MSTENVDITGQQLTAYALGELEGAERAAVEARLLSDPAAREEVDAVRATARLLTAELAGEPTASLAADQRAGVEGQLARAAYDNAAPAPAFPTVAPNRRLLLRGLAVAAAMLLAAATVWVIFHTLDRATSSQGLYSSSPTDPEDTQPQVRHSGAAAAPQTSPSVSSPTTGPSAYPGMGMYPGMMAPGSYGGMPGMPGMMPGMAPLPGTENSISKTFGPAYSERSNTETYDGVPDSKLVRVADQPLSTFSIDVDTASYSNVRRFLNANSLPPKEAVRVEELLNYFPYAYAPPKDGDAAPFAAHVEVAGCPWEKGHRLVRIGLKGKEIARDKRPPSNLVFLVDVSGSMADENKLPLVKQGLRMLVRELNENDRVAIVVYAGSTGLVLPSTTGDQKGTLLGAIDALGAGGSTNGSGGIERAYEVAVQNFRRGGVNRVLLCTDGDFNVGVTDPGDLTRLIEQKAKSGVFLSVLGFGMGNLKDATMEKLADKGNGNYAYVDSPAEARKVLVEQMSGTLVTIANDVKTQVEFNPAKVSAYRLIGYENRLLAKEDFNNDAKDAGEIGAGHTVTALYEVVPAGAGADEGAAGVDALKYQKAPAQSPRPASDTGPGASDELLTVKLRYKEPDASTSKLLEFPVTDGGVAYAKASEDFKFAASVAAFGMILRDSPHKGAATLDGVIELAEEGVGADPGGYRAEFVALAQKARALAAGK